MKKRIEFVIVAVCAIVFMISLVYCEELLINGVVKTFNSTTGVLVMKTASENEAMFTIPQTIKVYIKVKGKMIEVADTWRFLKDNLFKGTKVQILESKGVVTTVWILEVPA